MTTPIPRAAPAASLRRTAQDPFAEALDDARARLERGGAGRLRVWSVVVSLFGDAVAPRGGVLRLSAIQAVTDRLGLESGALRTAMSRLARDGWLTRERRGRASFYALTPEKQAETAAAGRRIYAAAPPAWAGGWTVATLRPRDSAERDAQCAALAAQGFGQAGAETWLRPACDGAAPIEPPAGAILIDAPPGAACVPAEAVAEAWPETEAARRFRDLLDMAEPIARALDAGAEPAPLDALTARCLLLHQWRRAALVASDLPAALLPADWPGEEARALMRRLYWRLAPVSEIWLDRCEGRHGGRLPPADPAMRRRFGGPPEQETAA